MESDPGDPGTAPWHAPIACAFVAGDLTAAGVARYGQLHIAEADLALDAARAAGLLTGSGSIDEAQMWSLVAALPIDLVAEVHLAAARHGFAAGPEHIPAAIAHARAAGTRMPLEELVNMADLGGRLCLTLGDYANARDLLTLATEFDVSSDHHNMAERLLDLAQAEDMVGNVDAARNRLVQTIVLSEISGDPHLVARAAVATTLPIDFYNGDTRSLSVIRSAAARDLSPDDAIAVTAARAIVEARIPLIPDQTDQVAWITRTDTAQALADEALTKSESCRDDVRLFAMLAWRTTHRAPEFLSRRREISTAALNLAQRLHDPNLQHEAAVLLLVDALESGDRPLYDRSVGVLQWIAQSTKNPRHRWRAIVTAAGAACLDGDFDAAQALAGEAREIGRSIDHPGWLAADFTFLGELIIARDDVEGAWAEIDETNPAVVNPHFRVGIAQLATRAGRHDDAERHLRIAFSQLDHEASYLHLLARITDVALHLDAPDLAGSLIELLEPWADHVAVDAAAWWCDGPVSVWLALLHHRLGNTEAATLHLAHGEELARVLNDVRSLDRAAALRLSLHVPRPPASGHAEKVGLTARELEILRLMARGQSNPEIAARLSFSQSTIRVDSMAIYRKLGVSRRSEAVAAAFTLGIIT